GPGLRLRSHRYLRPSRPGLETALQTRQLLLMPFPLETLMRRAVVVCLALLGAAPLAAQTSAPPGPLKIAFINSREILAKTPGYAAAESTFNREVAGYRAELQRRQQQRRGRSRAEHPRPRAAAPVTGAVGSPPAPWPPLPRPPTPCPRAKSRP